MSCRPTRPDTFAPGNLAKHRSWQVARLCNAAFLGAAKAGRTWRLSHEAPRCNATAVNLLPTGDPVLHQAKRIDPVKLERAGRYRALFLSLFSLTVTSGGSKPMPSLGWTCCLECSINRTNPVGLPCHDCLCKDCLHSPCRAMVSTPWQGTVLPFFSAHVACLEHR